MFVVTKTFATPTRRFRPGQQITEADLAELSVEQREKFRELGCFEDATPADAPAASVDPEQPAS